jgi:gamma-glutamyltranspeptidase/glutathione hydrolase
VSATRATGAVEVMAEQCLARSPRGVVAAAAPTAALVGAGALAAGGNAYDAAVAAALAETVLLPPKCGLGGDLVALAWHRELDEPEALLAIGGAPAGLAAVAAAGGLAETGPMSVGVPGAPAGYAALADRGRLGRRHLAAAAIDLATGGFCWSTICTVLAEESRELVLGHQPGGSRYYPGGEPIAPGAVVTLPGLARVLAEWVELGADLLTGAVGGAIVDRVRRAGGVLASDDLDLARAEWARATAAVVGGDRLWATPVPTHGPSLLDALGRLGSHPRPADVLEAVRRAIDSRHQSLADSSGTSMVSAVDRDGTIVTVVHSHSYPRFGSGLIVDEYDLILANRAGRGFTAEPGHPNFPAAGRRPATTLHAWALAPVAGGRIVGATPGGANQMPWNAQSLARLVGAEPTPLALARAIVGPRWELRADGGLRVEEGFDEPARGELSAAADSVGVERWALRSAMQIVAELENVAIAAVDPRTVGAAVPV